MESPGLWMWYVTQFKFNQHSIAFAKVVYSGAAFTLHLARATPLKTVAKRGVYRGSVGDHDKEENVPVVFATCYLCVCVAGVERFPCTEQRFYGETTYRSVCP